MPFHCKREKNKQAYCLILQLSEYMFSFISFHYKMLLELSDKNGFVFIFRLQAHNLQYMGTYTRPYTFYSASAWGFISFLSL